MSCNPAQIVDHVDAKGRKRNKYTENWLGALLAAMSNHRENKEDMMQQS